MSGETAGSIRSVNLVALLGRVMVAVITIPQRSTADVARRAPVGEHHQIRQ